MIAMPGIAGQVRAGMPLAKALHNSGLALERIQGILRHVWSPDEALMRVFKDCCNGESLAAAL